MGDRLKMLSMLLILFVAAVSTGESIVDKIEIFHKDMSPSLVTLEEVYPVIAQYSDTYEIKYYLITDSSSTGIIEEYNLPSTHFPFAVVINGKYSAMIDGEKIDFVHFPLFMHGIGRHEGNWSTEHLEKALNDNSLLIDENTLSPLEGDDTECSSTDPLTRVDSILTDAIAYLGVPYVEGGIDGTGFDCTGLTYRVYYDHGISLPRTVSSLETFGAFVSKEDLLPGDILIFHNPSHTGLYLGDGEFIHCSSYLDRGVVITPLSHSNYTRRYHSARRVL